MHHIRIRSNSLISVCVGVSQVMVSGYYEIKIPADR